MSDRPTLTHPQAQVLAYLVKFLELNDQLPPQATIAAAFGWSSSNAAFDHLEALEKKGYLTRNEIGNRMLTDRPSASARLCLWQRADDESETWKSTCGELWSFIDGGPAENRVSYCHHCGGVACVATLIGIDLANGSDWSKVQKEVAHG